MWNDLVIIEELNLFPGYYANNRGKEKSTILFSLYHLPSTKGYSTQYIQVGKVIFAVHCPIPVSLKYCQ